MDTQDAAPRSLLDRVMPRFDAHEVHETWVPAAVDVVYASVRQVTVREVRLLLPLEILRGLPRLLLGRRPSWPDPAAPVFDAFTSEVVLLGERPGMEIVAGTIGRFWRLVGNDPVQIRTRREFLSFAEPGYAKAVVAVTVSPQGCGTRVTTETRVAGTSLDATRLFGFYWFLIRPASGLTRRSWLAAIRRRATGSL